MNFGGSWLIFLDADGKVLANLPWDPLVGVAGAFFGDATGLGRAARWVIQFPDGGRMSGVSRVGNIYPYEPLRVEHRTVDDWTAELSSAVEPAPKGPPAIEHPVFLDSPLLKSKTARTYDLSPLANLATAVAWGLALERVVAEWRAWHPAARLRWDVECGPRKNTTGMLTMVFLIDGLGIVAEKRAKPDVPNLVENAHDVMARVVNGVREAAAARMIQHYVAPKAKAENRDAALRRFADGVRR